MSMRASSRAPVDVPGERSPRRAHQRSRSVIDTVLTLQRRAGNRAVNQAIRPRFSSPRVLARLPAEKIQKILTGSGATNVNRVSPDVIAMIAEIATVWEAEDQAWQAERTRKGKKGKYVEPPEVRLSDALEDNLRRYSGGALPEDADSWRRLLYGLINLLDAQPGEEYRGLKLQKLKDVSSEQGLAEPQGDVKLNQRFVIHCAMGQGVVANLARYTLYSDDFSSCSPVVMFNHHTRQGGLFHYAALDMRQRAELADMYHRVKPTWIGVRRAKTLQDTRWGRGEAVDEYHNLRRFFDNALRNEAPVDEIALKSQTVAVYLDDGGYAKADPTTHTVPVDANTHLVITTSKPKGAPTHAATEISHSGKLNTEVALLVNKKAHKRHGDARLTHV